MSTSIGEFSFQNSKNLKEKKQTNLPIACSWIQYNNLFIIFPFIFFLFGSINAGVSMIDESSRSDDSNLDKPVAQNVTNEDSDSQTSSNKRLVFSRLNPPPPSPV